MKQCKICKLEKSLEDFVKHRGNKDGLSYYCRLCNRQRHKEWELKTPGYIEKKREYNKNLARKLRIEKPELSHENYKKYTSTIKGHMATLLRNARFRSKSKSIVFTVSQQDLIDMWYKQNGLCAVSGMLMTTIKGKGRIPTAASLDRIIPELGYVLSNVRLVCIKVNEMKSDDSDSDLYSWCQKILSNKMPLYPNLEEETALEAVK